jgi:cytochrome c oxidase subunit 2
VSESAAARGEAIFRGRAGCSGCHGPNSSVRAPLLEGIYGRQIPVQIPKAGQRLEETQAETVTADHRYLHDAIVLPEKEVAAGYRPIMPTFKNRLTEEEVANLVAYIRSLADKTPGMERKTDNSGRLTPEDYKARTGFVPENMDQIRSGEAGTPGRGAQR